MNIHLRFDQRLSFPDNSTLCVLESLTIDSNAYRLLDGEAPITAFQDAPKLRDARLYRLARPHISLPWNQLTNLELTFQSLVQSLDILRETSSLQNLAVSAITEGQDSINTPRYTLRLLKSLHLSGPNSASLLPHLTLPALERVVLSDVSELRIYDRLRYLIARSSCSVRALRLAHTGLRLTHGLLWSLTTVRQLTLELPTWDLGEFSGMFNALANTAITNTAPSFLPELESLSIDAGPVGLEIDSLSYMLWARWQGFEVVQLKSCCISFAPKDDDHSLQVDERIAQLRALRTEGMVINIGPAHKWMTKKITAEIASCFRIAFWSV
ncbi:hypothetical protein DFH06DRAFT_602434 [Mycena polygramma]|nr:hypothetical protein DFH06DRAFT_602434 [Mycena polygramma]